MSRHPTSGGTVQVTTPAAASVVAEGAVAPGGKGPPAATWGIAILIASEATLFGCFIGTYYFLRFSASTWPPDGLPEPRVAVPLILVGLLVLTSVPMQLASRTARTGRLVATRLLIVTALAAQCGYLAYELHDFGAQLNRFDISRDAYSSIYYTLLGADHAHVLFGVLFNLWLLAKLTTGLTAYRTRAVQVVAWYWHAVNLLTLVVLGTLLSARI